MWANSLFPFLSRQAMYTDSSVCPSPRWNTLPLLCFQMFACDKYSAPINYRISTLNLYAFGNYILNYAFSIEFSLKNWCFVEYSYIFLSSMCLSKNKNKRLTFTIEFELDLKKSFGLAEPKLLWYLLLYQYRLELWKNVKIILVPSVLWINIRHFTRF